MMNPRAIKGKIKSIKNVSQITKAMQLVSAVKMKKAQAKASSGKPYQLALTASITSLVGGLGDYDNPLSRVNAHSKKKLAFVVSSNKGLCGVFNFNLFKFIYKEAFDIKSYDFVVMGLKARSFILALGGNVIADFSLNLPFVGNVTSIYSLLREKFVAGEYHAVEIFSNRFISSLSFKAEKKVILPLHPDTFLKQGVEENKVSREYLIEPDRKIVVDQLFNFFIENEIRAAILESEAAEHSARMIAMKNATDNAKDLVFDLTLLRNSIRQTKITNELLDMNTARLAVS